MTCVVLGIQLKEYGSPIESLAQFILATISDITVLVPSVAVEQESFLETACYLYRASVAIMELMTTDYTCQENAMEIFQSIARSVNLAKLLVEKCQQGIQPFSDPELITITGQLEEVIKHIGECLSFIPPSTFGDQHYAESSVQSLSNEMQTAHFEAQASKTSEIDKKTLSFRKQPKVEPTSTPTETDLYSISFEVSTENPWFLNAPQLIEMLKSTSWISKRKHEDMSGSLTTMPPVGQYLEPMYETFFCPLTNKVMEDPVTIRSGVTFERKAIMEWFEKLNGSEQTISCPTTGQKLMSKAFNENIALKTTIEQWKERNEAARIKVACAALSLASSDAMVLEAVKEVQSICRRKPYNNSQVRGVGILPLLVQCLEYKDKDVRSTVLELLLQLIEDDNESKEIIAETINIPTLIEMLSSSHQSVRHASLLFLLKLSRSQTVCEKIGSVTGAILMLITIKYGRSHDAFASDKAEETLRNLELSQNNIKRMAENGLMEPLLKNLAEGSEEMKIDMAGYLGEIALGHDSKSYVAQRVSPTLIKMVHNGNTLARSAAFRTLVQLSSHQPNANILVEAGIVQVMVEEMFIRKIHNEPMNSTSEAAAILANIFESGLELEELQVNSHGHTMTSDYVVHNIVYMLNNSTPDELNNNLIRILLVLAKIPKPEATIVSLVKETEASYTLIEFINNPHEQLSIAAIKLLTVLSPHIGHLLAERLCKTRGQPENLLIEHSTETALITEKQAVSAKFLAKLPHQNLTLNLALLYKNIVPTIIQKINQIQGRRTRSSRFESTYLEGLVGILVRFTTTLYEPQMLFLAKNQNFTTVFTELLMKTSSDEVQRSSAIGLENLSLESISLSKPPQIKRKKFMKLFYLPKYLSFGTSRRRRVPLCPVHRGACSSQNTFCIVDAKAVEKLLVCLENENPEVVEAALSAISTLLDDKVDVDKSVSMLSEVNAVQHVLNAVKEHRQEGLRQKSFWVLEKFLNKGGDESASYISNDRVLPAILVSAFHHGAGNTKQMAEKILRHLNKMPNLYT
uniref:putative U-box domain-containing protein 42 n=1 Tax=Fragaria vesca subsp. vesca TaxID=101020 RepID=UPI0005C80F96|nr:PREDICTED: putative U-box domain-containing protein 42 [Fragaria vesca subsp. vesca]